MRPKRSLISNIAKTIGLLCVPWAILAGFAINKTHRTRVEAEEFLREFRQLEVGQSTMEQMVRLANKYHGELHKGPALNGRGPCGPGSFYVEFGFDNSWLHWFLLARLATFEASVETKDNRVCYLGMAMGYAGVGFNAVSVEEFRESPTSRPFSADLGLSAVIVRMDVRAPKAARAAAFSINLDCLTKLRGCHGASEMAPAIWQNSREVAPNRWKSQWDE
jgi:hypothetical protein